MQAFRLFMRLLLWLDCVTVLVIRLRSYMPRVILHSRPVAVLADLAVALEALAVVAVPLLRMLLRLSQMILPRSCRMRL